MIMMMMMLSTTFCVMSVAQANTRLMSIDTTFL
jgi:hypothetical protein